MPDAGTGAFAGGRRYSGCASAETVMR